MTGQLREDEKFVMDAISKTFPGTWRCGEDPPDAYLTVNNREVAVEISDLIQSRSDGRGGTVPLLSDAMTPTRLATELNDELQGEIPRDRGFVLSLKWPFSNMRKVKKHLKREIRQLFSSSDSTRNFRIEGNEISIEIRCHGDDLGYVSAVAVSASLPRYDVRETAWCALQERITAKAEKCNALKFQGRPIWLALYDCYSFADVETYLGAMTMFKVDHPFEKILLISRDGSAVNELFRENS